MRRDDCWRPPGPPHLSPPAMVPGSQQQQQHLQQQSAGVPQYQLQSSQPGVPEYHQQSQQPSPQYLQQLQQQPDMQYHPHQLPQYNQQQRIIAIHHEQTYLQQQQQLHSGYYPSNVDQVPMIAAPPHAVTPSQSAVGYHLSPSMSPQGITRLHSPSPDQIRPLRHPSVIYHSPHPADQGPSSSFHHQQQPPVRAQTWVPPDPQQLEEQERQQIQQQLLQYSLTSDPWGSIPPIMPSATTPSPVPYQQPLSTSTSHFCPVHSLPSSSSHPPERKTPKAIPSSPTPPQLTEEEAEIEQQRVKEFVERFKVERIKFGYSSANVNQQLAIRYGTTFPAGKIDQFEANQLSLQEMISTKQVLKCWIIDMARASGMTEKKVQELSESVSPPRRELKKKRTIIDEHTKTVLDDEFAKNPKPSPAQQTEIAAKIGVEREVIKIWFANQRQRMKKTQQEKDADTWARNLVPGFNFEPDIPSADFESQIPMLDLEDQELEDL